MKIDYDMTPEIMYGCFRKLCQDCDKFGDFDDLYNWLLQSYTYDHIGKAQFDEMLGILQIYMMNYRKWFM